MWEDPIVAEVHRIRKELAARFNYDIHAMFEDMRRRQELLGSRLVREAKRSEPAATDDDDGGSASASNSLAESVPPAHAATNDVSPEIWQTLQVRWKTILGMEANIEALRVSMEGLRVQMEGAFRQGLNVEDKVHGLQADVAEWTKAKNRVHHALPKVREFVHRATWALGVPERKNLEAVFKTYIEPQVPFPELNKVPEQLDHLQKDRQILATQGNTVSQECRSILAEIQRALSTLQRNAADRARKARDAKRDKGKY
jgi:hypothetical protein